MFTATTGRIAERNRLPDQCQPKNSRPNDFPAFELTESEGDVGPHGDEGDDLCRKKSCRRHWEKRHAGGTSAVGRSLKELLMPN